MSRFALCRGSKVLWLLEVLGALTVRVFDSMAVLVLTFIDSGGFWADLFAASRLVVGFELWGMIS